MKLPDIIAKYREAQMRARLAEWTDNTRKSEANQRWRRNRAAQLHGDRRDRFLAAGEGA